MRNYKNIEAHKISDELVLELYKITKAFPKEELYSLTSQIRRAGVSIPTNIAEGASRQHTKEFLQFLYISRGSIAEVEYLVSLSDRLGYLEDSQSRKIKFLIFRTSKCLYYLIRSVEQGLEKD